MSHRDFATALRIGTAINFSLFESHVFPPFTFSMDPVPAYRVKTFSCRESVEVNGVRAAHGSQSRHHPQWISVMTVSAAADQ